MRRSPAAAAAAILVAMCLALGAGAPGFTQDQDGASGTPSPGGNPSLDYAQVLFVRATREAAGTWSFAVTVRHDDQGWEHYADRWQIVDPDEGIVIAERILAHPHEDEQPFVRSLGGVRVPSGETVVLVRAGCNRHGFGGREIRVDLERPRGKGFEVSNR